MMPTDMLRRLSDSAVRAYPTSLFLGSYDLSEIIAALPALQDATAAQLSAWIVTVTPDAADQLSNAKTVQLPKYSASSADEPVIEDAAQLEVVETEPVVETIAEETATQPVSDASHGSDTSLFDELLDSGFEQPVNHGASTTPRVERDASMPEIETEFESYYDDSLPENVGQMFFAPDELADVKIDVGQLQDYIIPPLSSLDAADALSRSVSASFVAPRQDEILAGLPAIRSDDEGFVDESTAAKYIDYYSKLTDLSDKYAESAAVIESLSEDEYIALQSQVSGVFERVSPIKFDAAMNVRSQIASEASALYRGAEMIRSQYHENMADSARRAAIAAARQFAEQNFGVYAQAFDEMLGDSSSYIAKLSNTNAAQSLELIVLAKRALSSQDAVDEILGKGVDYSLVNAYMGTLQYRVLVDRATSELIASFSDEVDAQQSLIAHKSAYAAVDGMPESQQTQPSGMQTPATTDQAPAQAEPSPGPGVYEVEDTANADKFDGAAFLAATAAQREADEAAELDSLKAEVAAGAAAVAGGVMTAQPQTDVDEIVDEDIEEPVDEPVMAYEPGDTGPQSALITEDDLEDDVFVPDTAGLKSVIDGSEGLADPLADQNDLTAVLDPVGTGEAEDFDEAAALADLAGADLSNDQVIAGDLESLLDEDTRNALDGVSSESKRKVPLAAKVGLGVGSLMLAASLGLGAMALTSGGGESSGDPAAVESKYTPEQLEKIKKLQALFDVGDVLNVTANGQSFEVKIAEMNDDGALVVDADNQQYQITWPQLDAYVLAHPDEFPGYESDGTASSSSSATSTPATATVKLDIDKLGEHSLEVAGKDVELLVPKTADTEVISVGDIVELTRTDGEKTLIDVTQVSMLDATADDAASKVESREILSDAEQKPIDTVKITGAVVEDAASAADSAANASDTTAASRASSQTSTPESNGSSGSESAIDKIKKETKDAPDSGASSNMTDGVEVSEGKQLAEASEAANAAAAAPEGPTANTGGRV